MNSSDNPFAALDKMLVSPSRTKRSGQGADTSWVKNDQTIPLSPNINMSEPQETERKSVRKSERTEIRSDLNSATSKGKIPVKRLSRRYSFEFYDDQILKLKQLKYEAGLAGKLLSLSDFVREALDEYLQNK